MKNLIFDIRYNPKSLQYGLTPSDLEGEIYLAKEYTEGAIQVMISLSDARTTQRHKWFFGIINVFTDNASEQSLKELVGLSVENVESRQLRDLVRKALLIECNYTEPTVIYYETEYKGETIKIREVRNSAKSISFEKMGEKEFVDLTQCVMSKVYDILRNSGWEEINIDLLFKNI